MRFEDLGLISYAEGERIQKAALEEVRAGGEERVYLLEHAPTVTIGRAAGTEHLLASPEALAAQGVEFVRSARGGDITCHYPGQMVAYPILRIDKRSGGIKGYFHDLEETVILTVAEFGVRASRVEGRAGVWVDQTRKICSMGVAVKRWVTWHGLSLNVSRDTSLFNSITLCGLPDATPASLRQEAGDDSISMEKVKHVFIRQFERVFAQ